MTETAKQFIEQQRICIKHGILPFADFDGELLRIIDLRGWFFSKQKEIEKETKGIVDPDIYATAQAEAWREFLEAIK